MRILLIEDNPGDARLVQEMLGETQGKFTVNVAETLRLGSEFLASEKVDVVLLDMGLPDSHGLETLIRLQTRFPHQPVVIMTGSDDEALGVRAVQSGAQDYLTKGQVNSGLLRRALTYAAERKEAEEKLKGRTRELQAANTDLEAFNYSVSHDLKAPLRSLEGFSRIVLEDYGDKLDEQGRDYLQRIKSSATLMSQLLDDMLQLSRIGRADMEFQNVHLSDLAQSIAGELKHSQPERDAEFIIQREVYAQGDESLLRMLLQNLLGNAWKYTGKCEAARIEFRATPDVSGDTAYSVKDNGVGFDMTYADKLFKPFRRLHSDKEFSGTGIGLAIVQRVVRRHGGNVWAEGGVGKGATFYFTLKESGQS